MNLEKRIAKGACYLLLPHIHEEITAGKTGKRLRCYESLRGTRHEPSPLFPMHTRIFTRP
ncbi:MAG: hypothetical protein HC945_04195 [Nitrosarchaeum sp.]|nr:hypothetical protein [Nitrosarchaeum sp.]